MKKIIPLLLIACIFITGCQNNTMENVQKKLEFAKTYHANIELNIKGAFDNKKIDYKRVKKVQINNINGIAKVNAKIKLNGENNNETYYIKTNKDTAITYKKTKNNYEQKEEPKDQNSIYYITAFINQNSTIIQEEKLKNGKKYVVKLDKNRVLNFLNSYYDVTFLNEDNIIIDKDVLLYLIIDKKGYIKSLEADFMDAIKYKDLDYNIEKFNLKINYNNFNNDYNIIIPNKILKNSLDNKLTTIRQYAIDYVKEVNDLKLGSTTYTNTLGYSIKSSNLTIVDNIVQTGNIIIENYNIKIVNGEVNNPQKIE